MNKRLVWKCLLGLVLGGAAGLHRNMAFMDLAVAVSALLFVFFAIFALSISFRLCALSAALCTVRLPDPNPRPAARLIPRH